MAKQNFYGDGVVRGKMIHKTQDARITYANTPVFDLATIPANRNVHIGGGVFAQSCTDENCDLYVLNWGPVGYIYEWAQHKAEGHETKHLVVGYNLAMIG